MRFLFSAIVLTVVLSTACEEHSNIRHKQSQRQETSSAVTLSSLRGESGSYAKDLSDSRIERITPSTQNVKSILGNTFIENTNTNTVRKAADFKNAKGDTLLGDGYVPLRNFKLFMGVDDGKLRVDSIGGFKDDAVVTPVRNKTDLTYSIKRQTAADMLNASRQEKKWKTAPPSGIAPEAVRDTINKYRTLSSHPVGFVRKDGSFVSMANMTRDKAILVSKNGNAMFLNNVSGFNSSQDSLVNDFLKRNGGAYPVQLDNGRYSHFLEGQEATYDKYMSNDLFRDPDNVWAFGEIGQ